MSRHRIVRSMNYEDEYYDEEDDYSRSVEDNYCISPGTAAQFTWNRDRDRNLDFATYMGGAPVIDEEGEDEEEGDSSAHCSLGDSGFATRLALSDKDQALMNSCLEEIRNIIGDTVSEAVMSDVIIQNSFNLEASLNQLLTQQEKPKPQREPRERRNRSQDDSDNCHEFRVSKVLETGVFQNVRNKEFYSLQSLCPRNVTRTENEMSDLSSGVRVMSVIDKPQDTNLPVDKTNLDMGGTGKVEKNLSLAQLADSSSKVLTKLGIVENENKSLPKQSLANLAKKDKCATKSSATKEMENVVIKPKLSLDEGMVKLSTLVAQHSAKNGMRDGTQILSEKKTMELRVSGEKVRETLFLKTRGGVHAEHIIATDPSLSVGSNSASKGISLSDLAKKHEVTQKENTSSSRSHKGITSPGLNLSDLAKMHGSPQLNPGPVPNVSLASLAKKHSSVQPSPLSSPHGSPKAGSGLSLSDLAKKHGTPHLSPVGSPKREGTIGAAGVSLSELAKAHEGKPTGASLSQLAIRYQTKASVPQGLSKQLREDSDSISARSLSSLIWHHSPEQSSNSLSSLIKKQKNASEIDIHTVKGLSSEVVQKLENVHISEDNLETKVHMNNNQKEMLSLDLSLASCLKSSHDLRKPAKIAQALSSPEEPQSEDVDPCHISSDEDAVHDTMPFHQVVAHKPLVSQASSLGIALCLKRKRKFCVPDAGLKYLDFQCTVQLKSKKLYKEQSLHTITGFDFSTPSPDDIIKRKQNQAFTRSEKEFVV